MQKLKVADVVSANMPTERALGARAAVFPPPIPLVTPVLLSDAQARQLVNVGERTWAELVATADWLPAPITLGPRLRRWNRDELIEALRTRVPRGNRGSEPAQLRRARIDRMKAGTNATGKEGRAMTLGVDAGTHSIAPPPGEAA